MLVGVALEYAQKIPDLYPKINPLPAASEHEINLQTSGPSAQWMSLAA